MKQKVVTALVVGCVVVAMLAFVHLANVASRGGETTPIYSNRRFDPYGTAALYRLLRERLEHVQSLERPRLTKHHHGVLIQVLGLSQDNSVLLNPDEDPYQLPTKILLDWVAKGNTLVQMTRRRTAVMDELGIPKPDRDSPWADQAWSIEEHEVKGGFPDDLPGESGQAIWDEQSQQSNTWGHGTRSITLRSPQTFGWDGSEHWRVLAELYGLPVAGEWRHGKGRVVVIGAPTAALNFELAEADNLTVLLGLVGDGPVIFDEWAHGVGHPGTVVEVIAQFGLVPFLIQLGVIMLVYRWSTAGLYRPNAQAQQRSRSSSEQIDTLGRLYDQAYSPDEKLRGVYDELLLRFARACRCPVDTVTSRLNSLKTEAAQQALSLLNQAGSLAAGQRPRCPSCGYDLTQQKGSACSECGATIPLRLRRLIHRQELVSVPAAGRASGHEASRTSSDGGLKPTLQGTTSGGTSGGGGSGVSGGGGGWNQRDLARMLTASHHLAQELQRG